MKLNDRLMSLSLTLFTLWLDISFPFLRFIYFLTVQNNPMGEVKLLKIIPCTDFKQS